MKLRNRILSAVMAIAACMTFVGTSVFADAPALSATPSTVEVKAGETFKIDVATVNNPGIVDLYVSVDATNETFTLTGVEDKKLYSGATLDSDYTKSEYLLCWWMDDTFSNDTLTSGTVATLTYKVNEGVQPGEYELNFVTDVDNTYCAAGDPVDFGSATVKVTVKGEEEAKVEVLEKKNNKEENAGEAYTQGFKLQVPVVEGATAVTGKFTKDAGANYTEAKEIFSDFAKFSGKASFVLGLNVKNVPANEEIDGQFDLVK